MATVAAELTVARRVMSQKGNEIVIQEWAAGEVVESLPARRDLDMTEGILIGLRRCDPNATYQELLGAAKRHGVALMAISSAVAHVAAIPNTGPTALEGRPILPPTANGAISSTSAGVTQSYRCGARGRSDERSHGAGE